MPHLDDDENDLLEWALQGPSREEEELAMEHRMHLTAEKMAAATGLTYNACLQAIRSTIVIWSDDDE